MTGDTPFVGEPSDSREAIMRATHRALCAHGYAGLSIQRIADEADLSKSTFYHHYDDKDDLLVSFVEYTLEEFVRIFSLETGDDPEENLRTLADLLISESPDVEWQLPENVDAIFGTYVELRAQAVRDDDVSRKFSEADATFTDQIEEILHAGIEQDVFDPADVEAAAGFLETVIAGNSFRRATSNRHSSDDVRAELDRYIDRQLLA